MKLHSSLLSVEDKFQILTDQKLSLDTVIKAVESPKHGAVVTFSGCIRDEEKNKPIGSIHYEAYNEMAEKGIEKIVEEAESRWETKCRAQHRHGEVPVGEAAVVIACAAPHRKEAFEACQFIIDEIKQRVPIWKVKFI